MPKSKNKRVGNSSDAGKKKSGDNKPADKAEKDESAVVEETVTAGDESKVDKSAVKAENSTQAAVGKDGRDDDPAKEKQSGGGDSGDWGGKEAGKGDKATKAPAATEGVASTDVTESAAKMTIDKDGKSKKQSKGKGEKKQPKAAASPEAKKNGDEGGGVKAASGGDKAESATANDSTSPAPAASASDNQNTAKPTPAVDATAVPSTNVANPPPTNTATTPTAAAAPSNNPSGAATRQTTQQQEPSVSQSQTQQAMDEYMMSNEYSDADDTLLTMSFNQDGGCLAVGTGSGFRVCISNPFHEMFRRELGGGGIAHIEMLYRTNLIAITGTNQSQQFPPNMVYMYDDHLQRTIGELSFRQRVLRTKMRRDRIVVVLRDRVYVYNFSDFALLDKVHTGDNPLGLCGISLDNGGVGGSTAAGSGDGRNNSNGLVLACPGTQRGQVRVELYGLRRTTTVVAHESALGALALSVDGSLLATASERGTVIRLFDTRGVTLGGGGGGDVRASGASAAASSSSSVPLREFRRGVERATVSSLVFSLDSNWLGCASNHGTVHVFQTHDPNGTSGNDDGDNSASAKKKKSGGMMRMLPKLVAAPRKYLVDGEQSYSQVRGVPHPRAIAFVPDRERTIAVAGMDEYGNGCLLLAEFGITKAASGNNKREKGGGAAAHGEVLEDTRRVGYHRFFKTKSPASHAGSGSRRLKSGSRDTRNAGASDDLVEGGAYIDDTPVDMRMNHISIGDVNEDNFVPIDYNMDK